MKKGFSTFDIVKALPIKNRDTLHNWMRLRFIIPETPAEGQGTKAVFTRWDVYGVALFNELINRVGYKRKEASEFVRGFIEEEKEQPAGREVEYIIFRHEVIDKVVHIQAVLVVKGVMAMYIPTGTPGHYDIKGSDFTPFDARAFYGQDTNPENWDHIHLVNFKKLKKVTDLALSKLNS